MRHVVLLTVLLVAFGFLMLRGVSSTPYTYDEADYMYAASLGFGANYADNPTLSIPDFVRAGFAKGKDPSKRQALSELVRASSDVVFYRHWHGPLFLYLLIPASRLGGGGERPVRTAMLAIPALTLAAIYFGCVWLIPGPLGTRAALIGSMLFLSSAALTGSTELAPHHLFALVAVCCLVLLAKFSVSGRLVWWYAAVVAVALACCTLEIAFVLIFTLLVYGYTFRDRIEMSPSLALFAVTIVAVWPAAVFKLSLVKGYVFMAYLALFRSAPWGNEGFFSTWRSRALDSPLELVAIVAGLVVYFRKSPGLVRLAKPMLIYSVLMLLATARVLSTSARYSLLLMPALDIFAALMLVSFLAATSRRGVLTANALFCGLLVINEYRMFARPRNSDPAPAAALHYVREKGLEDSALLVPQDLLPMLHYYFPRARLRGYYGSEPGLGDLTNFNTREVLYRSSPR